MPSPFGPPHPLARRVAQLLRAELGGREVGPDGAGGRAEGKMFGVLVGAAGAHVGWLRAVSGMLEGGWEREGFVPPVFDRAARDRFWLDGERELDALAAQIEAVDLEPARAALAAHASALGELRDRHRER